MSLKNTRNGSMSALDTPVVVSKAITCHVMGFDLSPRRIRDGFCQIFHHVMGFDMSLNGIRDGFCRTGHT